MKNDFFWSTKMTEPGAREVEEIQGGLTSMPWGVIYIALTSGGIDLSHVIDDQG